MKTPATEAAQLQNQIDDIHDILRCTEAFPDHPLARTVQPGLMAKRRALEQALARFA